MTDTKALRLLPCRSATATTKGTMTNPSLLCMASGMSLSTPMGLTLTISTEPDGR